MVQTVIKREGYVEEFDRNKINMAIEKAFTKTYAFKMNTPVEVVISYFEQIDQLTDLVCSKLTKNEYTVEEIQDIIEETLIEKGEKEVARNFISYRQEKAKKRDKNNWFVDDLSKSIWERKYQYNNETFDEFLNRVAGNNPKLRKLIAQKKFIFGGRIIAHRGIDKKTTYANCYVIPAPEDNIESIFETAKMLARTYSYGGGCGVDISKLRPRNALVNNSAKYTTGAVSFMELFDLTTGLIGQNGRRGALMISISDTHPDLLEFLDIKAKPNSITKANISVRVSDKFMKAVENNEDWTLMFDIPETGEKIVKIVPARHILKILARNNWDWAEPGMLFWDRISNWHLMSSHPEHKYEGVNPCAEEPLMAGGACLLGSLNLSEFVVHPFTEYAEFDFVKFADAVRTAVIGLNEVLDEGIDKHPLEIQRENARNWRQIGLGVMGIADMLIKMGIRYGSDESLYLCRSIARTMLNEAVRQSALLSKDFGSFPKYKWEYVEQSKFFQENINDNVKTLVKQYGLRNSQLLTIAPTGTISSMWGVSGGIEPIFAVSYTRKTESLFGEDVYFKVYTPVIKDLMYALNINKEEDLPDYVVTAHTLHWKDRVKMQSVWQEYIDASISSTVNLPNTTTIEEVEELYKFAWEKGLKGITVFRDGCKRAGILTVNTNKNNETDTSQTKQIVDLINEDYKDDKLTKCPECGEPIEVITGGCSICQNCGYSKCSE